ncbi:MAG: hypothetical protein K2H43_07350 [Clostridia bacterium]|nr:hypothetical protein [Clostridia bacterium]
MLKLMIGVIFREIGNVPEYRFDFLAFFIVLATFAVLYELANLRFVRKMSRASVRALCAE